MNKKNESFIDIKGILQYTTCNVKKAVLVFVVGALLGMGFGFVSNRVYSLQGASDQKAIETAKEALSDSRVSEINDVYSSYKSLVKQRDYLIKYLNNSIYLNLNTNTAKSNTIVYSIEGNHRMNALVAAYINGLKNDDLINAMKKVFNKKIDPAFLSELVSVSSGENISSNNTNVYLDTKSSSKSIVITVYANNADQCKKISSCVKQEFNNYTTKLKKTFGDFSIKTSQDTLKPVSASEIQTARSTYNDKISSISTAIPTISYYLNDDQKTYLSALIDSNARVNENKETKTVKVLNHSKVTLFAIIGGILLFIIYFIIETIKYVLGHKLHTEREFTNYFGINIIETAQCNNSTDFNVAVEEVLYLSKKDKSKIGLLSSIDHYGYINDLYKSIKEKTANCEVVSTSPTTKEEFDQLLEIDSVILFEELGTSNIEDIKKTLRYYELKGINVLGAVLLKK